MITVTNEETGEEIVISEEQRGQLEEKDPYGGHLADVFSHAEDGRLTVESGNFGFMLMQAGYLWFSG
jgi:hypothetical protein